MFLTGRGSDFGQPDRALRRERQASTKKRRPEERLFEDGGGAEGDRTPDLCNAIAALSQLSYGPVPERPFRADSDQCKPFMHRPEDPPVRP